MKKNTSATTAQRKQNVNAQHPPIPKKPSNISQVLPPKLLIKPQNISDDESDDEDEYGYIQPEAETGDLANLVRKAGSLPICVKVISDPPIKDAECKGGDILMIHCSDQEQVVKAKDTDGNSLYLPLHSNQLYEILPLDPKLDGKIYRGTMELMKADPLPQVVRVLIGYFDERDEDDTKEQNDIITIEGVSEGPDDEMYLTGEIMGEPQRFRAMEDEAVYTTQIIPEHLSLPQIIKHELPMRVRTVSTLSSSKGPPKGLEFRLERLVKRERLIATRVRGGAILGIPFSAPLKLDLITPTWKCIPSLINPLYPLVNTSMCKKGLSDVDLPRTAMKAVSQPKKVVLDEWLQSQEAKILINEIAEEENVEMQKKVSGLLGDLKRAETELSFFKNQQRSPPPIPQSPAPPILQSTVPTILHSIETVPPAIPPRSPCHRPSSLPIFPQGSQVSPMSSPSALEPPLPVRTSSRSRSSSMDAEMEPYEDVVMKKSSSQTSIGLASTDLEKELKNLLGEKILEIQTKDKEYRSLLEQHKSLQSKFDEQTKRFSELEQELEILKDQEDCYDLMIPGKQKASKRSPDKGHHVLPMRLSAEASHVNPAKFKSPKAPIPSVPVSPGTSTLTRGSGPKHPRDEYDPLPLSAISGKDDLSLRPRLRSPEKKVSSPRFPLPTEPLHPPQNLETSDIMSLPLSQQTDSFKRSKASRPSHIQSISSVKKFPLPTLPVSEYDIPESSPPPPPLPLGPRPTSMQVTKSSKLSSEPLPPHSSYNPFLYATPEADLSTFTKEMVSVLLRSINLDDCVNRFLEESVDGILLMSIDEEMMIKELGMTSFQARKLTIKIDELSHTRSTTQR